MTTSLENPCVCWEMLLDNVLPGEGAKSGSIILEWRSNASGGQVGDVYIHIYMYMKLLLQTTFYFLL